MGQFFRARVIDGPVLAAQMADPRRDSGLDGGA